MMSAGGCELFVYYKVAQGEASAAQQEIHTLQAALRQRWPGLEARLLKRDDLAGDGPQTWMEIYRTSTTPTISTGLTSQAVTDILSHMAEAPTGRLGLRHTERFVPLDLD